MALSICPRSITSRSTITITRAKGSQFLPRQWPNRFPIVRLHMIQRDYLIIGSGIGGSSACESIRKYDKRGQITLVGAETFAPYKRWMLSKTFLRDKVTPMKKMPVLDAHWYEKHKIEIGRAS